MEFALVMPLLFLILFGIVEFGLNINDYQSIRQGAREGARQAVVGDYGATQACGLDGAAASATGTDGTNSQSVMCTTKTRSGLGNDLRVKVVFKPGVTNKDGDFGKVKVCTTRPAKSITGLLRPFLSNVNLRSQIEMRAEKALTLKTSLAENDPSGANWSWCTDYP